MRVAVLCEYSGTVRDAFIRRGHDAVSYDLLPSDSSYGPHLIGDIQSLGEDHFAHLSRDCRGYGGSMGVE